MAALDGRAALVTGSTRGIGFGIARALAAQGAAVMLNGFGDADEIERRRAGLAAEFGVEVRYLDADLTRSEHVERLVRETEAAFGRIDILCNNAGALHAAAIDEHPPARWDLVVALNLTAPFHAIRLALPGMKARGWGRIVNTSSALGLVAAPGRVGYAATKHGLIGMTKVVALETAGTGVTCNAICPGLVNTEGVGIMVDRIMAREGLSRVDATAKLLTGMQPDGVLVEVEDVAAVVAFLCSDGAASVTGIAMPIDRGWTAR